MSSTRQKKQIKVEVTEEQINHRIDQIEALDCDAELRDFLINILKTIVELDRLVGLKSATITRLRKVFGKQTEKQNKKDPKDKKEAKGNTGGSGRHGQDKYPEAEEVLHLHTVLKEKDFCPECEKGKVYSWEPGVYIRVSGSPPLVPVIHKTQKLRCNLCGQIFEADFEGKNKEKFDSSAKAIIALMHYKSSLPLYRLEKLQEKLNIPMPRSTLWLQVEKLANCLIHIWKPMVNLGANGDLFYVDDTKARLLSLIRESELNKENKKHRKGMYTTGILSKYKEHQIILYFTGQKYAGENLTELLNKRTSVEPVAVMSDALNQNNPKGHEILKYLCLTHGRRNFIDLEDKFKEESAYVLEIISEVYKNDSFCEKEKMSNQERLIYHQENSGPLMDVLKLWMDKSFKKKLVEPNSSLGKGIKYMQRHWKGLTAFLKHSGAPLDNNLLERQFRVPVLNRKNWLFYKNSYGAFVGDIILSIIKTCDLENVNAFDYMVQIQDHIEEVKLNPNDWMPWNYKSNLT